MKDEENTMIDDETLPMELEFRVSSMILIFGVVIIGLDLLGISAGRSPILLLWSSGAGLIGSYFYFRSVPAIRMSQDRVEYAVAPLRSTKIITPTDES